MKSFIFGADGLPKTPEELARMRAMADALMPSRAPQNVGEGISSIGNAIMYRALMNKADNGQKAGVDAATSGFSSVLKALTGGGAAVPAPSITAPAVAAGAQSPSIQSPDTSAEIAKTDPAATDMSGNQIYGDFIKTVKSGVTNPYGLAAIAATGKAESGYSPDNANRSWSDPSQSGAPGTAGGIMSWRGPRLQALYDYASSKGEKPGAISPATQAEFFLREDPNLISKLNSAKSVDEAQSMMNRAWAFAGYDQPGGEAARRMSLANSYLPNFQGQDTQVASLSPMPPAIAAQPGMAETASPKMGYVDPMVSAPNYKPQAAAPALPAPVDVPTLPVAGAPAASPDPGKDLGMLRALAGLSGRDPSATGAFPAAPGVQVAQAAPAGGFDITSAIEAANNPFLPEGKRAVLQALIGQQLEQQKAQRELQIRQADPAYQTELQLKKAQLNQITNPQMSPGDAARLQLEEQKLKTDQENRNSLTAAEKAQNDLAREKFGYERENGALTPDLKEYRAYAEGEKAAGRQPLSQLDYQIAVKRAGANSTTVNTGEGSKFYGKLDEQNAQMFSSLSDGAIQARNKIGQIDRLEQLMSKAPQGAVGALKQAAGEWGIPTTGLSDIQAASALLESLVPQQRPAGSGTMSDSDIRMYRASLPRLLNQPGGNQLIFQTMRGIAQYEMQMGDIADRVANREITPAEGRSLIKSVKNPLADFKPPAEGPTPNEGWKEAPGIPGVKIRLKGNQ